jgi:hypothetical protein
MTNTQKQKKLSEAQLNALTLLTIYNIEVGAEGISGLRRVTLYKLEDLGFVHAKGIRKVFWTITKDGRKALDKADLTATSKDGVVVVEGDR